MKKLTLCLMLLLLFVSAGCRKDKPEDVKNDKKTETQEESKQDKKKKKDSKDGLDLKSLFNKRKDGDETQGGEDDPGDTGSEKKDPQTEAFGIKSYSANEEISIDLNHDGKEEVLKLEQAASAYEGEEEDLYGDYKDYYLNINGERLEYTGRGYEAGIKLTDIDVDDDRVEIFVHVRDVGIFEDVLCFHYNGSELEEVYFTDNANALLYLDILEVRPDKTIVFLGEDSFTIYDQSLEMNKDLGQFFTDETYLLRDGVLAYLGTPKYIKTSESWRKEAPYHVTVTGMDVFDKPMGTKIGELAQGDVFYLYGVKKFNPQYIAEYEDYYYMEGWADIKSDSGVSGWIEVPFGEFYVSNPNDEYSGLYHWN